jgi:hypothetical protein
MTDPDETSSLPLLHRFFLAVAGLVLSFSVWSSIQTGAVKAGRSTPVVHRATNPEAFWAVVTLETLLSLGTLFIAVSGKNQLRK